MLTYEQQTEKLLKRRTDLEKRVREDSAEIEKINAKLNEMQLEKVRDAFGLDQKAFFELITKHPEQLMELTAQGKTVGTVKGDKEKTQDDAVMDGQTSFFDTKHNHYSET